MENPFDTISQQLLEIRQAQLEINRKLDEIRKHDSDEDELITRLEKAKQLRVSLPTLKNWESQGLISPVRIGRRVYFRKGTVHPKSAIVYTR